MIYTVDSSALKSALISAANNLCNNKDILNDLNVFPVPDGDTGSNMSMTVMAAVRELQASDFKTVSDVLKCVSSAALRGARGNSGVILSQLFRGMAKGLKDKETMDSKELAISFKEAVNAAYRAVMKPAEGTILSVSRDGADHALSVAETEADILVLLKETVKEAQKSLDNTPNLLPQLKLAGVVDAGGQGVLYLLEGALSYAETGKIVALTDSSMAPAPKKSAAQSADTDIEFAYCTEFLINKKYANEDCSSFVNSIKTKGDSMVVIDDDGIVKVHIHTNHPGFVIEQALKLGELTNLKIDNMRYQHDELTDTVEKTEVKEEMPHKEYAFAAVASGDGFSEILKDMEIDRIVEGGQTMNPSTDDIYNAIKDLNADNIVIFPNNKNIIMAAEQVKNLTDKNIIVIPTRSVPECITAKLVFAPEMTPAENEAEMTEIIKTVRTGSVTYSVRDFVFNDEKVEKGKILGLDGGKITKVGDTPIDVLKELLASMADEDSEIISIYCGEEVSQEDTEAIEEYAAAAYSDCDVAVLRGGQPIYYYIVSVE